MTTIDIKLKSYDQLVFEITKLNTDIYLKDKEIARLNKIIDELEKYLTTNIRHSADRHFYGNVYYKLQELKGDE